MKVIEVSGVLTPNAAGLYEESGTYNGKPSYTCKTATFYIWWNTVAINTWAISAEIGNFVGDLWFYQGRASVEGIYSPSGDVRGVAFSRFVGLPFLGRREQYVGFRKRN